MRIGASLFLIAIGAILKWAVTEHVNNVNLGAIGVILMVVGAVGLVLSLILVASRRRIDVIHENAVAPLPPTYAQPQAYAAGPNPRTTYYEPGYRA